jgi:AraC family transcriptional regulator of adaptative response/methylated-DNA-[protein]-cysteine methyltransferase
MPPEQSYHYTVVRRAIDLIDAAEGPLTLECLASGLGMSAADVQRVFSAWVGVSPKRYQQYLALGQARRLLRDRFATLAAADAVGLSGGGRLHDLFPRWEAMTPGQYAAGCAGLEVRWGRFDSPFGPAIVAGTERGLCGIAFAAETGEDAARADLFGHWPRAAFREDEAFLHPWAMAAFGAGAAAAGTPLFLIGAPFQIEVWEALLRIPSGRVTTYAEIAAAIGRPRAVRAVGTAVGRNPLSWLIPCHRVLRRSGGLGGYRWGLSVKRAMLAWEAAQAEARDAPSEAAA